MLQGIILLDNIDENYQFRFGVGASIYSAETWNYQSKMDSITRIKTVYYQKSKTETIGGIATRLDFMAKDYQHLLAHLFNSLMNRYLETLGSRYQLFKSIFLRFDANAYFKVFASSPHPWENKSFFLPMARFIINF